MSIKSIIKINEDVNVSSKPSGWIVREIYDPERKRSKLLEFGIYVNEDTFLGISLHYSFKDKLIPINGNYNDEFNYYLMGDIEVALSVFKNKKGKVMPALTVPTENNPAIKIACIAISAPPQKIISASVKRDDNIIIRDYIDKERNYIAAIIGCNDASVINPAIEFDVDTAVVNSTYLTTKSFNIGMEPTISSDSKNVTEPIKTKYIKFNRFIKKPRPKTDNADKEANVSTETDNK